MSAQTPVQPEFSSLESFFSWYKANGYPLKPPTDGAVFVTDIAYSYCLYRHGRFQVEIYLVKPNAHSPEHSHPGVENIIMLMGGDAFAGGIPPRVDQAEMRDVFGVCGPKITDADTHALGTGARGAAFLSVEMWPATTPPTSLSLNWEGNTCGPVHADLLATKGV
jgi:hypothetical protein